MRRLGDALPTVLVVTSLDGLLPGQAALLDNGTDPPRLVRKRLDGSVPDVAAPTLYARAVKRLEQVLPNGAWTRVTFDSQPETAGGALVGSTFTCKKAGVWDISVGIVWAGAQQLAAGDYINVAVRKNNTEVMKITEEVVGASGPRASTAAGPLRLMAGDVIEVWAYGTPGRSILGSSEGDLTTWSMVRVGA